MSASDSCDRLYFAVLLTEITVDGPGHVPSIEESFVLLRAVSDEDARDVASAYARRQENSYLNEYGETVRWSHREVVSVERVRDWSQPLTEDLLAEGTELWSRFCTDLEAYKARWGHTRLEE